MEIKKITLMVPNFDEVSDEEIKLLIERVKYPNWCMQPEVMEIETRDVEWSDDHPLNKTNTYRGEFKKLFSQNPGELEAATARAEKAEKTHSDLIDFVSKKVREHEESKDWEQREYAPIVISEIGEYLEELKSVEGE